ncbi:hypothetical protein ABH899_004593 [Paenibacillus sp. RC84]
MPHSGRARLRQKGRSPTPSLFCLRSAGGIAVRLPRYWRHLPEPLGSVRARADVHPGCVGARSPRVQIESAAADRRAQAYAAASCRKLRTDDACSVRGCPPNAERCSAAPSIVSCCVKPSVVFLVLLNDFFKEHYSAHFYASFHNYLIFNIIFPLALPDSAYSIAF